MIKTKNGEVQIKVKGGLSEVMTEYTTITKAVIVCLIENGMQKEEAVDVITEAINIAKCDSEEEQMKYMRTRSLEMLKEMLEREEEVNE